MLKIAVRLSLLAVKTNKLQLALIKKQFSKCLGQVQDCVIKNNNVADRKWLFIE